MFSSLEASLITSYVPFKADSESVCDFLFESFNIKVKLLCYTALLLPYRYYVVPVSTTVV